MRGLGFARFYLCIALLAEVPSARMRSHWKILSLTIARDKCASVDRADQLPDGRQPFHNRTPTSRIRLDAKVIIDG